MKNVTKYISIALILAAGLFSSCGKDLVFSDSAADNQITVTATIANEGTKVSFVEDGTTLKSEWQATDNIVGWDEDGNVLELEIKKIDDNGAAVFKPVSGSAPIPTSGKVYMIYAPGKSYSDVSNKSLEYDLSSQSLDEVPALMTATGEVTGNVLALTFKNELAIVAVKNPTFPVTEATTFSGLKISGDNINTVATFGSDDNGVTVTPSVSGSITRSCTIKTNTSGNTTANVLFAILPNSTPADVKVSTVAPAGYQISFEDKSFADGQCYLLEGKQFKKIFTITIADGITNGTITTSPAGSCEEGQTVTVIPAPSAGYKVKTIKYNDGTSDFDITSTKSFTMPCANVTVSATFKEDVVLLNGEFSVAANGKKVKFTRGNLYWNGGAFDVEDYQYDFRTWASQAACIGGAVTDDGTPADNVGLLMWTMNASNSYAMKNTETATGANDESFHKEGKGFTVGSESDLYLLSKDEWVWLLGPDDNQSPGSNCRTSSTINGIANGRWTHCTVSNVVGLLLFPDNFSWPEGADAPSQPAKVNEIQGAYADNIYTGEQFKMLENSGAVFLPAVGSRGITTVNYANDTGYYATSTAQDASFVNYVYFANKWVDPTNKTGRGSGQAVRLVKKVTQAQK